MRKKVVVGMSGGVDSSAAAYLLKEQGYDVIGVTMRTWQENDTQTAEAEGVSRSLGAVDDAQAAETEGVSCGLGAVDDARRVAAQLDIPHYVMNFCAEFKEYVIDYFVKEYQRGRTPNPCIACNRYVKWEALLRRSIEIGADYIATGHYAQIGQLSNGRYALRQSASLRKDQTYALYGLTQDQLRHTLFPIGAYDKEQIREIAKSSGLDVAHKPDSQEICFIPDHDYTGFICRETGKEEPAGNFVTKEGIVLGQHRGISHYTIGQRKGLGIAFGRPVFVTEIRPDTNEVVLGENEDLMASELTADSMNYMAAERLEPGMRMTAKIRYSHAGERCEVSEVSEDGSKIRICFEKPVRAVTPGQAVVLYDGGYVLGGGSICAASYSDSFE